jgi:hypothetical protein
MTSLLSHLSGFKTRLRALAFLALVLSLVAPVATPLAQGPSDDELASQLEAIVLEETLLPGAVNTVIEIPVQQDTYITSNKPNTNYGRSSELRLGYNLGGSNDGALRPFLQFDVGRYIPDGAVINSAVLRTYLFAVTPAGDAPMTAIGRHLLTPWDEDQVTWNNHQPNWGGVAGSGEVGTQLGWQQQDVTALVEDWYHNTYNNYGMIFIGDERVQERQRIFHSLNANNGLYPRLVVNYTLQTDPTPPNAWVRPLSPYSQETFTVHWRGDDTGGSGIAYFDIQYRAGDSTWMDWQVHVQYRSAQFAGGANGVTYYFRARAVDNAGNVQLFGPAQAQTTIDTLPPSVSVNALPGYTFTPSFQVTWSGSDNPGGSGIQSYDVQFQKDNGPWQAWLVNTTATSAQFTGGQDGSTYGFRARGTDVAGNVQPYTAVAQAATRVEITGPNSHIVPFDPPITQADSFSVSWTGSTAPGLSVLYFDVRYRFNDGPWIAWLSETQLTSATFDSLNPQDGIYGFEVRAKDSAGRLEPYTGQAESSMIVDRNAPYVVPQVFLPMAARRFSPY